MKIFECVRKIFDKHLRTGLLPIRHSELYYHFLESRFFEQENPFRRLLLNTDADMKKVVFGNPEQNN